MTTGRDLVTADGGEELEGEWPSPFSQIGKTKSAGATMSFGPNQGPSKFLALPWAESPSGTSAAEYVAHLNDRDTGEENEMPHDAEEFEHGLDEEEGAALASEAEGTDTEDEAFDEEQQEWATIDLGEEETLPDREGDFEGEAASLHDDVELEEEIEALGDLPDEAELDQDEIEWAREWGEETEVGGPTRAGMMTIDKVPLLRAHSGIGPDLILAWNDMRAAPRTIDVVIHLHGYSLSRGSKLHIERDLMPRSGLDWSDPTGADGRPGRTRPTLALLPRGHFFGGKSGRGYRFPALTQSGLRRLVDFGLQQLATSLGVVVPTCNRLILTAHSGGGAALLRILADVDPQEVHIFDGLYQDAGALIRWVRRRIGRDQSAIPSGTTPLEHYMAEKGGALRVLYRGGTALHSRSVAVALQNAIPVGSILRRWYRVERTAVGHEKIPPVFGWRLLADAAADLPGVPYVPTMKGSKLTKNGTSMLTKEGPDEELEEGEIEDAYTEAESPATGPPSAQELVWENATEEQREFMRRVYNRHVDRSAKRKGARFVPSVPPKQLGEVEHEQWMRKPAARGCVAMLAHARAALDSEKDLGNAAALRVKAFGARSGYRSVEKQFNGWQSGFRNKYYPETQNNRARLRGGPHGEAAVDSLAKYVGKRIAAPGYSLHNNGLAMDFFTKEGALSLGPNTSDKSVAAWKGTWLFNWLSRNAVTHGFFQNPGIDEPWHWEYRGPVDEAAEAAAEYGTTVDDQYLSSEMAVATEDGSDAASHEAGEVIEARELDPALLDIAEKVIAREESLFEQQVGTRWTKCFTAAHVAKVKKVYEDNAAAASADSGDRCSCIVMLNVGLGQLLGLLLKENRARSSSDRRVQMGNLTTKTIEKAMQQLRRKGYAVAPTLMNFYDRRNRTAGTLKPERLKASVQDKVLASSKTKACWYAFGMSIMDGYHSVLLLVDHTNADAKIYWLDQFSTGVDDDVTSSLDQRLTDKTQAWWQLVMDTKGKGYNTTIRLWPLRRPLKTR